jgi:hypothetical protein
VLLAFLPGGIILVASISSCRKQAPPSPSQTSQTAITTQPETAGAQARNEQSCRQFVGDFYNWYLAPDPSNGRPKAGDRAWSDVLRLRPDALSPELLSLLKDDLAASQASRDEIVGLDWDPFLASQDPSSTFSVESVSVRDDHCDAWVNGIEGGKKQESVGPELIRNGQSWVFVNFHYKGQSPEDENLVSTLKVLRDERKKTTK